MAFSIQYAIYGPNGDWPIPGSTRWLRKDAIKGFVGIDDPAVARTAWVDYVVDGYSVRKVRIERIERIESRQRGKR